MQNFLQMSFSVLLYNVTEKPYWQCKWFQVFIVFSLPIILVFSLLANFLMQFLLSQYSSFHMPYLIFHFGFSFHIFCKVHVCKSARFYVECSWKLSYLNSNSNGLTMFVQFKYQISSMWSFLEMLLYDVSLSLSLCLPQEKQSWF
jgi:hypothetical protein